MYTKSLKYRTLESDSIRKAIGITKKSNKKMVLNLDPRQKENFQQRILKNLTTNS